MASSAVISKGDGLLGTYVDLFNDTDFYIRYQGLNIGPRNPETKQRTITCNMVINGADGDDIAANYRALVGKVREASLYGGPWGKDEPITLGLKLFDNSNEVYFDVFNASITPGSIYEDWMEATLVLICSEYARGARVDLASSGSIDLATGYFMVSDIPGDADAITTVTVTGTMAKVRIGRRSKQAMTSSDFTPIIDLVAMSGVTTNVEATGFGADNLSRSLAYSSGWLDMGSADMPNLPLHHGVFDIFIRARHGNAALATPSAPSLTLEDGPPQSGLQMEFDRSGEDINTTAGSSISMSWSGATEEGSACIAVMGWFASANNISVTPPAGWQEIYFDIGSYPGGGSSDYTYLAAFLIPDAASRSGSETFTLSASVNESHGYMFSVKKAAAESPVVFIDTLNVDVNAGAGISTDSSMALVTSADYGMVVPVYAYGDDLSGFRAVNGGYTTRAGASGELLLVGTKFTTENGSEQQASVSWGHGGEPTNARALLGAMLFIKQEPFEQEDVPGNLAAGSYTFYAQDVSVTGKSSALSTGTAQSITNGNAKVTVSIPTRDEWTSHQRIYVLFNSKYYYAATPDNDGTDIEITDLAALTPVDSVSGITAETNYDMLRIKAGSINGAMHEQEPILLTGSSSALFYLYHAGTVQLPPIPRMFDETRRRGRIEVQMKNGGGATHTGYVDCIYLFPHHEPSVMAERVGGSLSGDIVIDTDKHGRVSGEALSGGSQSGQVSAIGELSLAPGDNMIIFNITGTEDDQLSSMNATAALQISYSPLFDIVPGSY